MLNTTLHPAFQTTIDNQIDGITVNPEALLHELLDTNQSLYDVAAFHKLSLRQLIVWFDQPGIQSLLDKADAAAARVAAHKAAQARPRAVNFLADQTHYLPDDPRLREEGARAARAILKVPTPPDEPTDKPIGELISRPRRAKHTKDLRRDSSAPETAPPIRIPVYRFRLAPPNPVPPLGPLTITPYSIVESDTPENMGKAAVLQALAGSCSTSLRRPTGADLTPPS